MKTLSTILTVLFFISCTTKQEYSDYFDDNLKGSPKIIEEYEIFSISDLFSDDTLRYTDSSISQLTRITKYTYDSLDSKFIIYQKDFFDSIGHSSVFDSSITRTKYDDSTIITSTRYDWYQKLIYDKKGFLIYNILINPRTDTTNYIRNNNGIIIKKIEKNYGVDTKNKIIHNYRLNNSNDIIEEQITKELYYAMFDSVEHIQETFQFDYIYDDVNNWIIKTTNQNGEIIKITQRKIRY